LERLISIDSVCFFVRVLAFWYIVLGYIPRIVGIRELYCVFEELFVDNRRILRSVVGWIDVI
jgi:hypothetical protein